MEINLRPYHSRGAQVRRTETGAWRLEIPAGRSGQYRLAQLDDYSIRSRRNFLWKPPLRLALRACCSAPELPGTWGFGLWNDPFTVSLGLGGSARRLPALPNAAWFFYASPHNYLSFRSDMPAQGFLTATFSSNAMPAPLLYAGSLALPLFMLPFIGRGMRWLAGKLIKENSRSIPLEPVTWRAYALEWEKAQVNFYVDDQLFFTTKVSPRPPLGLVLWIDNQFASLPPDGRPKYGALEYPEAAWLELADITIET